MAIYLSQLFVIALSLYHACLNYNVELLLYVRVVSLKLRKFLGSLFADGFAFLLAILFLHNLQIVALEHLYEFVCPHIFLKCLSWELLYQYLTQ